MPRLVEDRAQNGARRVVVTGVGLVTPLGTGVEKNWTALMAGRSGIAPITRFECGDFPTRIAGEVRPTDGQFRIFGLRGDFTLVPNVNHITFVDTKSIQEGETPELPMARYRIRDQVTELSMGDLKFSPAEAGLFFQERWMVKGCV